jgi:hypothetical protein
MSAAPLDTIEAGGLVPTLLDFERMPGRYRLALREPSLLFEQTLAVMQLAAGRPVKGMAPLGKGREARAAQKAARFFVRTVLLRAGTDHHTLLGLKPNFEPEALRDHYRLMIRLTHPDFSMPGTEWPADAASRINIANGVLGSVVQRAQYDASLKAAASAMPQGHPMAPTPASPVARLRPAPAPSARERERERSFKDKYGERITRRQRRKIALATSGVLACVVLLLLWLATPSGNEGSLVAQRAQPAATPALATTDARALADRMVASAAQLKAQQPGVQPSAAPVAEQTPAPIPAPVAEKPTAPVAAVAPLVVAAPAAEPIAAPVAAPVAKSVLRPSAEPAMEPEAVAEAAHNTPVRAPAGATIAQNAVAESAVAVAAAVALAVVPRLPRATSPPTQDDRVGASEGALPTVAAVPATTTPVPTWAPAPATAPVEQRAVAAEPTARGVAAIAPQEPKAPAEAPLTMARVQPKLMQVLKGLQSGQGENVTQWLDGPWREHPAANTFVKTYTQLVAGQRVVQLGQVKLRSRWVAEQFVVDGVVELYVQDSSTVQQVRRLQMRAHFVPKDGQAVLTQVVLNNP